MTCLDCVVRFMILQHECPKFKLSRLLEKKPQPGSQTSKRLVYRIFWMRNPFQGTARPIFNWRRPARFLDGTAGINHMFRHLAHPLRIFHE